MVRKRKAVAPEMAPLAEVFRQLPVKLTPEELVTYRDRAASIIEELDHLSDHKKAWLQEYNKSRALIVTEQRRIARAIRDRAEDRSVECEERMNFASNAVHVYRLDTGAQVDVRPMTANDRQGELLR